MGRITVRLPEGVEADLDAYVDARDVDRETAVRRLLAERLRAWRAGEVAAEPDGGDPADARVATEADRSAMKFARLIAERDAAVPEAEDHAGDDER